MGIIRALALGTCLAAASMGGYYAGNSSRSDTPVQAAAAGPDIHGTKYMKGEWGGFPDGLKKELAMEELRSMSNDELYRAGREIIIYRLGKRTRSREKPLPKNNITEVYKMLKSYEEGRR